MRKLNTTITALMLVSLLSYGGAVLAQDYDDDDNDTPAVLFGPQAGISKVDGEDPNFIFGAAMRFKFLPILGLEGSINYRQEEFGDDALTVRSWPVQVTGMLYPVNWLYGAMGAGWYMTTFDYDPDLVFLDDDTQSEFGWHFGGGLEIPLGSVASLAGDLRYVFIDYNFEEFPGSDDIQSNFYMATAGILFRL
jgi:hypothetical protein